MKLFSSLMLIVFSIGMLSGCAHRNNATGEPQAVGQAANPTASETGQQVVDVKSPETGQSSNFQNQGSPGAAKMISPLTQ